MGSDTVVFVMVWSIGIGAFAVWFMKELTKNERPDNEKKRDDE